MDYEAQKRYTSKLTTDDGVCLPDPYSISDDLWQNDVKKWPNLEFGDLFMYLIESEGTFTKEKLKAYKSLEAYITIISTDMYKLFIMDCQRPCVS